MVRAGFYLSLAANLMVNTYCCIVYYSVLFCSRHTDEITATASKYYSVHHVWARWTPNPMSKAKKGFRRGRETGEKWLYNFVHPVFDVVEKHQRIDSNGTHHVSMCLRLRSRNHHHRRDNCGRQRKIRAKRTQIERESGSNGEAAGLPHCHNRQRTVPYITLLSNLGWVEFALLLWQLFVFLVDNGK